MAQKFSIVWLLVFACVGTLSSQTPAPIIFVADEAYAPITFNAAGEPKGVYVDITRALGRVMNRPIEIRLLAWSAAQQAVLDNDNVVAAGMTVTESRKRLYDFADPVLSLEFSLVVTQNQLLDHSSIADLTGRKIGVTAGGYPREAVGQVRGTKLVIVTDYSDGLQKLQAGQIDALAADTWVVSYLITQNKLTGFAVIYPPFAVLPSSLAPWQLAQVFW